MVFAALDILFLVLNQKQQQKKKTKTVEPFKRRHGCSRPNRPGRVESGVVDLQKKNQQQQKNVLVTELR